jgi:outer membrane autotransporter protein
VAIETARANLRAVGERQRQLRQAARRGRGGGSVTLDLSLPRPADARVSGLGGYAPPAPGTTWTEGSAIARLWSRVESALDAAPGEAAAQDPAEVEAGADEARGGVFLSGRLSSGDRDATGLEPGLDYGAGGGTLGLDYRAGARTFLGLAAGYADSTSDFSGQGGELGLQAESLTAYVTFAGERFYLDLVAGFGSDSFDLRRSLALPDGSGGTFTVDGSGSPDGEERTVELGFGWDFPAGASTWTIAARGSWVDVAIDSFVETLGGSGIQMQIFEQDVESLLGEAALEWTHAASFDWGVLQPQVSAAARHEFEDGTRSLRGRFVGDPAGGEFVLPTDPADSTYFAARAGLSAIFPRGWALYANGESEFGRDDLSVTTLSAGLRVEW